MPAVENVDELDRSPVAHVGKQTVITKRVGLVTVGGVSAILVALSLAAMRITGLFGIERFDSTEERLLYIADHQAVYLTQQSFMMLTFLLAVPAALGLYRALRPAESTAVIALAAAVAGALIGVGGALLNMSLWARLTPAYAEAQAATRPILEVTYETLIGVGPSHQLTWVLLSGIGVGLFSVAILRTALLPKWVAWLGLFVALAGWVHLPTAVFPTAVWDAWVFHETNFTLFNVWMLVVGVALLRLREPASPGSREVDL